MKSNTIKVVTGLCVFIVFLIAHLPATQVLYRVTLPNSINISGVSGTLWEGEASIVTLNGLTAKRLKWKLSALPLIWGSVWLDISAGNNRDPEQIAFNGSLQTSLPDFNDIETTDAMIFLPADQVLANVSLPLPVKAGGRFRVIINNLKADQGCQSLNANGEWLNAEVAGTQGAIKMGNFSALLTCEDNAIVASVSEPNLLGLNVTATIKGVRDISASGIFKPAPTLPDEVHQAARFFGQPNEDGYISFKL